MSIKVNFMEYIKDTFVHNTILFDFNKSNLSDCNCRYVLSLFCTPVFLNRQAAAQYRALASFIPGCKRPEETTICYKISLIQ